MVGWNPGGFWSSDLGSVSIWLISGLFVMEWSTCTLLRNKRNWWGSRAKCNTYLWYWRSLEVLTGLLLSSFQQTNPAHRRHFYSKNMFQDSQWMTEIMNSTRPYTCCSFFHFYISTKKIKHQDDSIIIITLNINVLKIPKRHRDYWDWTLRNSKTQWYPASTNIIWIYSHE